MAEGSEEGVIVMNEVVGDIEGAKRGVSFNHEIGKNRIKNR